MILNLGVPGIYLQLTYYSVSHPCTVKSKTVKLLAIPELWSLSIFTHLTYLDISLILSPCQAVKHCHLLLGICPISFRERCRLNSPGYFSTIIFWWFICHGDSQRVIPSAQVWILTIEPYKPCPKMRIWEAYPQGHYLSYREIWPEIGQYYRKHILACASAMSWISVSLATLCITLKTPSKWARYIFKCAQ